MKRGRERCAFSAQRHVAAAKIGDSGYSRARGDDVRVADLQGKGSLRARLVPDRLAVTSDRANKGFIDAVPCQEVVGRLHEAFADPVVEKPQLVDIAGSRVPAGTE